MAASEDSGERGPGSASPPSPSRKASGDVSEVTTPGKAPSRAAVGSDDGPPMTTAAPSVAPTAMVTAAAPSCADLPRVSWPGCHQATGGAISAESPDARYPA